MTAYKQEIECWHKLGRDQRALLLAFVWCMKLRMDGTSYDEMFPDKPQADYRAD
jgi:hypothetical protein